MKTEESKREMRDGALILRVSEDGSGCTLALAGELDLANAETLTSELKRAEAANDGTLWIDLSELEFIDSTGIAILVATHRRLTGSARLHLLPSRANAVQRVMSLTGLDAELPFSPPPDGVRAGS